MKNIEDITNYKELAKALEPIDLKGEGLLFKAMLYNSLIKDLDISEKEEDIIVQKCYELYKDGDASMFRNDIEEEVIFAFSAYENGENPYEDEDYEENNQEEFFDETRRWDREAWRYLEETHNINQQELYEKNLNLWVEIMKKINDFLDSEAGDLPNDLFKNQFYDLCDKLGDEITNKTQNIRRLK